MKSTEIEAERVVSTSGLLTGRPNASWPQWVSALLRKAFSFGDMSERQPPLHRHPLFLHSSPLLAPSLTTCGVQEYTQCNSHAQADARHTHRHTYICSVSNNTSVLRVRALIWTLTLQSAPVSSGRHQPWLPPSHGRPVQAGVKLPHRNLLKIQYCMPALFITPSLFRSLCLYQIKKTISHRTINGYQRQGRF